MAELSRYVWFLVHTNVETGEKIVEPDYVETPEAREELRKKAPSILFNRVIKPNMGLSHWRSEVRQMHRHKMDTASRLKLIS